MVRLGAAYRGLYIGGHDRVDVAGEVGALHVWSASSRSERKKRSCGKDQSRQSQRRPRAHAASMRRQCKTWNMLTSPFAWEVGPAPREGPVGRVSGSAAGSSFKPRVESNRHGGATFD